MSSRKRPDANHGIYKIRLRKGDTVVVRSGKHKGQSGKVLAIHPRVNKVTVEGINIFKRHLKPTRARPTGGIIEITKPIWVSKVGLQEPDSKKPSRLGIKLNAQGEKVRYFKRTGKDVR